jgi:hypothetical protein
MPYKIYPTVFTPGEPLTVEGLKDDTYKVSFASADGRQHFTEIVIKNGRGILKQYAENLIKVAYFL